MTVLKKNGIEVYMPEDDEKSRQNMIIAAEFKLMQQLDRLDVTDRHYDRKYQDMQGRLDTLYDRIADLEEKIDDVTNKISGAYDENLSSKQLCRVLLQFDDMFEEMTELERKEFLNLFIDRIELCPERQENGTILKKIVLKFRIDSDDEDGGKVLLNETTVETCALLTKASEARLKCYRHSCFGECEARERNFL